MNAINYVSGLLTELQGAIQRDEKNTETAVRAELKSAVEAAKGVDLSQLEEGAVAEARAVLRRAEEALGGGKRTAKAAAAPETATPPAAK